jgi:tripartite-type tricarboxylate transporter receptor subunit TctC
MAASGATPGDMTPAQFETFVRAEIARLGAAVRAIGITAED